MAEPADAGDDHCIARLGVGHLQALVDRHARAEHRRDLVEAHIAGQVADIVGVGQHIVGEPAIDRIAGVELAFAQRLPAAEAVHAMAAGSVEPGHADPVAFLHMGDALAHGRNETHAFVARNEGRFGLHRPVAFGGMQIGVAHARGLDGHLDHTRLHFRNRHFLDPQRFAEGADDGGFHALAHSNSPVFLLCSGAVRRTFTAPACRLRRSRASSRCS